MFLGGKISDLGSTRLLWLLQYLVGEPKAGIWETIKEFERYAGQVKGLVSGEDVLFVEDDKERWIRLIHTKSNSGREEFFNVEDPIAVMLAANGPKGQSIVG